MHMSAVTDLGGEDDDSCIHIVITSLDPIRFRS